MRTLAARLVSATEGLSNAEIAWILALGLTLGTFPAPGCPTVLCLLAAAALRLNVPALQIVNQLSSPLQLALLIPYARLGSWVMHAPAGSKWSGAAFQAVAGWCCVTIPLAFVLFVSTLYVLRSRREECFNRLESPAR